MDIKINARVNAYTKLGTLGSGVEPALDYIEKEDVDKLFDGGEVKPDPGSPELPEGYEYVTPEDIDKLF